MFVAVIVDILFWTICFKIAIDVTMKDDNVLLVSLDLIIIVHLVPIILLVPLNA
jgi:hypothetical protein